MRIVLLSKLKEVHYQTLVQFLKKQLAARLKKTCIELSLQLWCQVDNGIITDSDKDLLPITEFAYGPLEYDLEEAKFSIGSLKCSGLSKGKSSLDSNLAPKLLQNDCGLGELVTDNRLKINLRYQSDMKCYVTLKLPEYKTMKLTIDDFKSEDSYDYFYVYDGQNCYCPA